MRQKVSFLIQTKKKKGHRPHTGLRGQAVRQVLLCRPPGRGECGEGQTTRTWSPYSWNCAEMRMQRWGWFGERCIRGPAGRDPPRRTGPETRVRWCAGRPRSSLGTWYGPERWGCGVRGGRGAGGKKSGPHARRRLLNPLYAFMPEGGQQRPRAAYIARRLVPSAPEGVPTPERVWGHPNRKYFRPPCVV